MITGWEKYTEDLTDYERETLLPAIGRGIKLRIGKDKIISNAEMLRKLQAGGYKTSGPRIRKILHVLRVSGLVKGIVSSGNGYYIADNPEDYKKYIKSLQERIKHITTLRASLISQYSEAFPEEQMKLKI